MSFLELEIIEYDNDAGEYKPVPCTIRCANVIRINIHFVSNEERAELTKNKQVVRYILNDGSSLISASYNYIDAKRLLFNDGNLIKTGGNF